MDDQQTYLLNGLLARNFGLGRIVRFRPVERGRQAQCFELFTAQEKEYLVQLYPSTFAAEGLDFAAGAVNLLDTNRFSVMPFVRSKQVAFVGEGPQGQHMLVSLAPSGSALAAHDYTQHDISQVGLRLAWMHRLLKEQVAEPKDRQTLAERFHELCVTKAPAQERSAVLGDDLFQHLDGLLRLAGPKGWCHGDFQLAALLHDSDHQLRAITDWGLLHFGCPLEDLVEVFMALSADREGVLDRKRGRALLEAYDSLVPIKGVPWTPIVATWCVQRFIDHEERQRPLPPDVQALLLNPERLAPILASCL